MASTLAVAGDEGNGGAAVEQIDCCLDLGGLDREFCAICAMIFACWLWLRRRPAAPGYGISERVEFARSNGGSPASDRSLDGKLLAMEGQVRTMPICDSFQAHLPDKAQ